MRHSCDEVSPVQVAMDGRSFENSKNERLGVLIGIQKWVCVCVCFFRFRFTVLYSG